MCIAKNPPQFHGRTKHIGIKYHYTRDLINSGEIRLEYCPTEDMVADMLTKAVSQDRLNRLKQICGMSILPSSEECQRSALLEETTSSNYNTTHYEYHYCTNNVFYF